MEGRLHAPIGFACEGGDAEHSLILRTFVAYPRFKHEGKDAVLTTWCDECATYADLDDGQWERVCPVIRIDEHGIGVWQTHDGWWGAPLLNLTDMPDLLAEFYVLDADDLNTDELIDFLDGIAGFPGAHSRRPS